MAQQRIRRHAGGKMERVYLDPNRRLLHPECHLHHLVTLREVKVLKYNVCHPFMWRYILFFTTVSFSNLMHMPRMASSIEILFQICWLMTDRPLVSTLSGVWYCCRHPFCRQTLPFERIWQWRQELWEWNRIVEYYHYLQLADTLKYILKNIFICIISKQCSDKVVCIWRG